jgi:hypothetical protein
VAVNIIADPSWDEAALPGGARMGAVGARDRPHAVPRHRDLNDRCAQPHHPQLQAVRRAARRVADGDAPGEVLRGADQAEKVDARDLYILKPELVGAAMATSDDRRGLANKGEGGG